MNNELKILSDSESSVAAVIAAITALEKEATHDSVCSFGLSSNVTLNGLDLEIKRCSFLYGHRPNVIMGNYRDHTGNAEIFASAGVQYALFLWFFDALIPGLGVRVDACSEEEIADLCSLFTKELAAVLEYADQFDRVFTPKMHKIRFGSSLRAESAESRLVDKFNSIIDTEVAERHNVIVLDISNIICRLGVHSCIDERMYFLYKNPYREKFFYHLAADMYKEVRGHNRYFKKVLILDCDNTLWRGVVGEEGLSGIKLSPEDFPGNIFWQAQHFIISLQKRGVLLAICSKNDEASVDEVLEKHEFCPLKNENFIVKKINWKSKVENIKDIATELDLGLDSFVFLDDSDFECEAVKIYLPQVAVFQVPQKISDYITVLKQISDLFPLETGHKKNDKTLEYRLRAQAVQEAAKWDSKDEYLRSLATKVILRKNETERVSRISELTQKTNQFNLTTRRYSESDILHYMKSDNAAVYSLHVSDKFGVSGLVGVCILRYDGDCAVVEAFLLSCRVIGRGVEYSVWGHIREDALKAGAVRMVAEFIPTAKNAIVKDFFDELGFETVQDTSNGRTYQKKINDSSCFKDLEKKYFLEVYYDVRNG